MRFVKAPHLPVAGGSSAASFNEQLQVGLLFFYGMPEFVRRISRGLVELSFQSTSNNSDGCVQRMKLRHLDALMFGAQHLSPASGGEVASLAFGASEWFGAW